MEAALSIQQKQIFRGEYVHLFHGALNGICAHKDTVHVGSLTATEPQKLIERAARIAAAAMVHLEETFQEPERPRPAPLEPVGFDAPPQEPTPVQ